MATPPLKGFQELQKALKDLGAEAGGKDLRAALMQASLPAFKQARANAPVGEVPHRTYRGRLVAPGFGRRSVARKSRLSRDKSTATVMIGVKPEAYYMVAFVEIGTSKMPKQPWLEPALRSTQTEVVDRFKDRLRRRIEKRAAR